MAESSILCSDRYIWYEGNEAYGRQFYCDEIGFGHIEDHEGYTGAETKIVFADLDGVTVYRTGGEYADIDDLDDVKSVIKGAMEFVQTSRANTEHKVAA